MPLDPHALVLLVDNDPGNIACVQQALAGFRLQCVGQISTAGARIAGGGVSAILLNLSPVRTAEEGLKGFLHLLREAPDVPVIVLHGPQEEELALRAVRAGAAGHMSKERCGADLYPLVQSFIESPGANRSSGPEQVKEGQKVAHMVTFLGAKGGVGTTLVALNVSGALARRNKVIVAELRSTLGSLRQNFRLQCRVRDVAHLLEMEPATISAAPVASFLWPYRNLPGLFCLFGPETADPRNDVGPDHAKAILGSLSTLADYVVVDLPAGLTQTNRAVIQASDILGVVVEREPVCIESARLALQVIQSWEATPQIGAVLVNRTSLGHSVPESEIEAQLGVPVFGTIPPVPDLCCAAQKARAPLVLFEPESLAAACLQSLAERLANPGPCK